MCLKQLAKFQVWIQWGLSKKYVQLCPEFFSPIYKLPIVSVAIFFLHQYSPPATVLNFWGIRSVRIADILYFATCLLRHRAASAWEWGETSSKESFRMQASSLVTVRWACPQGCVWLVHWCVGPGEHREQQAGDSWRGGEICVCSCTCWGSWSCCEVSPGNLMVKGV